MGEVHLGQPCLVAVGQGEIEEGEYEKEKLKDEREVSFREEAGVTVAGETVAERHADEALEEEEIQAPAVADGIDKSAQAGQDARQQDGRCRQLSLIHI